jgi:hypothetical protein
MNVTQMISELHAERAALDEAIAVLERIARSHRRGRGRPPAWLATAGAATHASPKRVFSAATRAKMAEAQRKRWAAYRKGQSK